MDDAEVEKSSTQSGDIEEQGRGRSFAPINSRTQRAHSRKSSRTLSRTRSQNGYGVSDAASSDGGDDDVGGENAADAGVPPLEKDPYEVRWDNGDADPMSPRSLGKLRKWCIVVIVSMASFCV